MPHLTHSFSLTLTYVINMIFFRKSYQKLLFALSLCLCFFSQNVFGQHGFSQTSNYLSQTDFASVELNFRNAEDPQDPDPIATVKYEGGGVFQSGQSVEFSWEEVEIYQGGPNGYEEPGDGTSRTDSTQLTDNHYVDNRDPAWSPDGEWIAWAPITDEGLTTGQFVMSPEGARKTPRLLATLG
ncbi:MAG: hypothetical protein R6U20_05185 [Longimonas sp.]|uniref:hypothetical protein n=1 Tax=Longimonas sp. TaxID=2039626 RepID=UPI003976A5E4